VDTYYCVTDSVLPYNFVLVHSGLTIFVDTICYADFTLDRFVLAKSYLSVMVE